MMRKLFFSLQYLLHPRWDTGVTPPELNNFIQQHPPGRSLDLGCGTATNVIWLAEKGWHASGVDFASRAIAKGRKKARNAGVQVSLYTSDVSKPLPFEQPFDLIFDIGCLHSLPAKLRTGYFSNLFRLLDKGGYYLLYGFTSEDGQQPGLSAHDIEQLSSRLKLINRQDGSDTASSKRSTWFIFENQTGSIQA